MVQVETHQKRNHLGQLQLAEAKYSGHGEAPSVRVKYNISHRAHQEQI